MRTRALAVAGSGLAALALAACGSSGSTGTTSSGGGGSASVPTHVIQSTAPGFDAVSIYKEAEPGVVTITSVFSGSSGSSVFSSGRQAAIGAGSVVDTDGNIVTNAHVVTDVDLSGGSGPVHPAKQLYVQFADRNRVPATLVGYDLNDDVALIKVNPDGLDLKPLELATDEKLEVGQPVAAIGSPFEQNESLSVGVVSALDRALQSFTDFRIEGGIQTDAQSTRATRAGRCSTPRAGWWASTARFRPRTAPTRASPSRFRSPRQSARLTS